MVPPDNQANESDLAEWTDFNNAVIAEFRANGGRVGGYWEGVSLLLLHTIGAKSGVERIHPVTRSADGDRVFVVASRGGDDRNPDWYYNLVAHPQVVVETGSETLHMVANVAEEPERTRLFEQRVAERAVFKDYEAQTSRVIPVVILSPKLDVGRLTAGRAPAPRAIGATTDEGPSIRCFSGEWHRLDFQARSRCRFPFHCRGETDVQIEHPRVRRRPVGGSAAECAVRRRFGK